MTMHTAPADRKEMVQAISKNLGTPFVYTQARTFAYRIGDVTVNRDGSISCEDAGLLDTLKPMLLEKGFLTSDAAEEQEEQIQEPGAEQDSTAEQIQEPDRLSLQLPIEGHIPVKALRNLMSMLYSMQRLLCKAIGEDWVRVSAKASEALQEPGIATVDDFAARLADLRATGDVKGVDVSDDILTFELPLDDSAALYSVLFTKVMDACRHANSVKAQLKPLGDNEKYLMHTWLMRIGCGGADFKELRKALTANLTGFCAFPDQARADRHKAMCAEIRKIRREINKEADTR